MIYTAAIMTWIAVGILLAKRIKNDPEDEILYWEDEANLFRGTVFLFWPIIAIALAPLVTISIIGKGISKMTGLNK